MLAEIKEGYRGSMTKCDEAKQKRLSLIACKALKVSVSVRSGTRRFMPECSAGPIEALARNTGESETSETESAAWSGQVAHRSVLGRWPIGRQWEMAAV
ncbi:hypothetical protein MRX96_011627 [Rhipicephalus microplus]